MPICTFQRLRSHMFLFFCWYKFPYVPFSFSFCHVSKNIFPLHIVFRLIKKNIPPSYMRKTYTHVTHLRSKHIYTYILPIYVQNPVGHAWELKGYCSLLLFLFHSGSCLLLKGLWIVLFLSLFIRNKMYNFFSSFYKKQSLIFSTLPLFIIKPLNKEFASLIILYHF